MNEPPKILDLIWKSVVRRPFRSAATIVCFALIASCILSSSILIGSAEMSVSTSKDRMGADLIIVPRGYENLSTTEPSGGGMMGGGASAPSTGQLALLMADQSELYFNMTELERVRGTDGVVRVSPQTYAPSPLRIITRLVGFDPDSDFTIQPWIAGREIRPLGHGEVVLGSAVVLHNTTILTLYGQPFNVTERLDRTGTAMDTTAFIRLDDLYSLSTDAPAQGTLGLTLEDGQISAITVLKEQSIDQYALAENITTLAPDTYAIASSRLRSSLADQFTAVSASLGFTALIVTLVVVPQVALVSTMVSNERSGEFGMFRALGATKRFVFGTVFTETFLLAAIGGLVGLAGTCLAFVIVQTQMGTGALGPFLWPSAAALATGMFVALTVALLVGGLSAIYPAYTSSRQEPYETIRKGGGR
jgi:putative ABC transport system permease protein